MYHRKPRTFEYTVFIAFMLLNLSCNESTEPDGQNQPDTESRDTVDKEDAGDETTSPKCTFELPELTTESIAPDQTFQRPVFVTQPPGESDSLYVITQPGQIKIVEDGQVKEEPFLDIEDRVLSPKDGGGNEQGLLGLAFHPNYEQNGRFFINYTPDETPNRNVVAEYHRSDDNPEKADRQEVRRLVEPEDPDSNHNGGMLAFGPEGYLYAAFGDGGGANDQGHGPFGNGQDRETLLGTIMRFDVDAPDDDFIPEDNPFVGESGRDEIWAYGLRNAWRFSFDSKTGDLYIGDVGQNAVEEIDFEPAESEGGRNYGWCVYEGNRRNDDCPADSLKGAEHTPPLLAVQQSSYEEVVRNAASITGGYVYRGEAIPSMKGVYLYGDYQSRDVGAFRYCDGEVQDHKRVPGLESGKILVSFGQDNAGELYLVYFNQDFQTGSVEKIIKD